ncbi:hypothetical protein GCM10009733_039930 [Nonomuraea maheshkhaliensis]|uniref:Uncharacterized protein n=1 Tax=Nonomuraea maheshkhaliensis TaxID=419590 RepID=A0ABN2FBS2_9ACTN
MGTGQAEVAEFAGAGGRMAQHGADDTEQLALMVLVEDRLLQKHAHAADADAVGVDVQLAVGP